MLILSLIFIISCSSPSNPDNGNEGNNGGSTVPPPTGPTEEELIAKYGIVIVLFLISFVLFVVGIICTIMAFCTSEKNP